MVGAFHVLAENRVKFDKFMKELTYGVSAKGK